MAAINRLTARQVDTLKPGFHSDGANLYLRVGPTGSRSWVFRYSSSGRVGELGLGATHSRGLKDAREVAGRMRAAIADGNDPAAILKPKADPAAQTFKAYATAFVEAKGREFRNGKHHAQWTSTLTAYAYPTIGNKRPADISYGDVQAVLNQTGLIGKHETMSRLRQRIQVILDEAAKKEGQPERYNPAMSIKLPKRTKDIEHHAAAPWQDVPAVMAGLRLKACTSAMLLRFSILTAARSGEARGALWTEIDLEAGMWVIPATRMKAKKLHRVPLCEEALAILKVMATMRAERQTRVFPGGRGGLLSDVAVNKVLHSVKEGVTAHGFRSSFRQWGADNGMNREALELALAHTNPNVVEASYQRSDLLEVRKVIMKDWADYCCG